MKRYLMWLLHISIYSPRLNNFMQNKPTENKYNQVFFQSPLKIYSVLLKFNIFRNIIFKKP